MKASNAISSRTGNPAAQARNGESSSSTVERFALSGPSADLDPRYHAFRGDLADVALASRLFAPHYAAPVIRQAVEDAVLRAKPEDSADEVGSLESGALFAMLDVTGDWAWGYRQADHLVGYVAASALAEG